MPAEDDVLVVDESPPDETRWITQTRPGQRADLPSIVLLHGSGQDETALLSFAEAAYPGRTLIAVRGRIPWDSGYVFFRRRPDRTLGQLWELDPSQAKVNAGTDLMAGRALPISPSSDISRASPGWEVTAFAAAGYTPQDADRLGGSVGPG